MAAKTSWHRYGMKLRHCHPVYTRLFVMLMWLHWHYTHTRLTALFLGLPRWAGTRKVKPIWILLEQETVSGSGISWSVCKSAPRSRQITTPAPHHSIFYTPDSLPATQPTVSKHKYIGTICFRNTLSCLIIIGCCWSVRITMIRWRMMRNGFWMRWLWMAWDTLVPLVFRFQKNTVWDLFLLSNRLFLLLLKFSFRVTISFINLKSWGFTD